MRSFLMHSLAGAGLILLSVSINAQVYGGYRGDDRYGNQGYGRDNYAGAAEPLDRVIFDLDRAAGDVGYLSRGELRRFNHARDEIREFQGKWRRGHFDKGELDDVISGLQHIVDNNRLEYRDRDVLINDLGRLRDFRARSGYRNGRNDRYGRDDRYGYDQYGYRR